MSHDNSQTERSIEARQMASLVQHIDSRLNTIETRVTYSNTPAERPPYFRGNPGKDFNEFIDLFNRFAQHEDMDEEMKRMRLPYYLRGIAHEHYRSLNQNERDDYECCLFFEKKTL